MPGVVESLKIITERASTRIAEFAFDHARSQRAQAGDRHPQGEHHEAQRRAVPRLHAEGLARSYTDITYDERIVDAACMQLVMHPERFDVLLLPNLYGDIVSDLCAGLVGGLGVVPGANMGVDSAVFEAVHGSAPDIANKNLANPTALLLSALMMLDHIGEAAHGQRIRAALGRVLTRGEVRTRDLGGTASDDGVHRRHLPRTGEMMLDDITQAVLAREDVARYLRGGHGQRKSRPASGSTPISTSCGRRSAIRSTAP